MNDPITGKRTRLASTSAAFARELFARHPDWRAYAAAYDLEVEGYLERHLELRIPAAHPYVQDPLRVQVKPREVYLEWAGWHDHVFWWEGEPLATCLRSAVETIELWISDRYLFATVYAGEQRVREWGTLLDHADALRLLNEPMAPGERTLIRSWRGTHDRTLGQDSA